MPRKFAIRTPNIHWIWRNQRTQIIQERVQRSAETPFQLFYGQDMKRRGLGLPRTRGGRGFSPDESYS